MADSETKVLEELNSTLKDAGSGKSELPAEKLSDFSTAGMEFADATVLIMDRTEDLFALTGTLNRRSSGYLRTCKVLVRAVDHLGSAFLTKHAFTRRGICFPQLKPLHVERLNRMLSFNMRKCSAAMDEIRETRQEFASEHFDMMLTLARSMARLRATENRASKLGCTPQKEKDLYQSGSAFSDRDEVFRYTKKYYEDMPFRDAPAYSLRYDVLRAHDKEMAARKAKGSAQVKEQRPEVKPLPAASAYREEDPEAVKALPAASAEMPSPEPFVEAETPDDGQELPGFVRILQDAACLDENGEKCFRFTPEDVQTLLDDPEFVEIFTDLAEQMRRGNNSS